MRSLVRSSFPYTRTSPTRTAASISTTTTSTSSTADAAAEPESTALPRPTQSVAKARLTPGEWDPTTRTNPLYRPKFTSNAKLLSADDFAARPKVGTSIEFNNFTDAMVTLSWLTARDQQQIYSLYCDIMLNNGEQGATTSHEYAMRVVAQRFRITSQRVAAVVRLQHNEQQLIRAGAVLADDVSEYMDASITKEINAAYHALGGGDRRDSQSPPPRAPDSFVEDPVGLQARGESKTYQPVDDVLDVPALWTETVAREEYQAKAYVDGYNYKEDTDRSTVLVPLDDDCQALLKRAQALHASSKEAKYTAQAPARWKFVAQTVNTRAMKKNKHSKTTGCSNNSPRNTIVADIDGVIRAGTAADTAGVAWKQAREPEEFIYAPVQAAWLERQRTGDTSLWGKAPAKAAGAVTAGGKEKEQDAAEATTVQLEGEDPQEQDTLETASKDSDSSDSSSSSDDEDGAESSDSSDEEQPEESVEENDEEPQKEEETEDPSKKE